MRLSEGIRVGDWLLIEGGRLGRDVWLVENGQGVTAVLKTARGSAHISKSRFVHEVQVLRKLQALPGVLRLLDADSGPSPAWMVTERATTIVDKFGIEPDLRAVVSAFLDVATTLADAANVGIAHRDVKPSNLFHARGRGVVGDFGLATGHNNQDLTLEGSRVGPANFAAPEVLQWSASTDAYAADVFSFAKSLWSVAAGKSYPPQGPLLIRLAEVDLTDVAGRAAQDLARLLELATQTSPNVRPSMATMRDELGVWLDLHPSASTAQRAEVRYRTIYDEYFSVPALDRQGLSKVLDRAVHQLLDGCRHLRVGSSSLTEDSNAWLDPQLDVMSNGDPDWAPDHVSTKKLVWTDLPDLRVVATGVLEGEDDLTYEVAWQVRNPDTLAWSAIWRDRQRARLRLPSELATRRDLQTKIHEQAPPRLSAGLKGPTGPAAEALRRVAEAASRREAERRADDQQSAARRAATADALTLLNDFWDRLTEYVRAIEPEARAAHGQDAWLLTVGDRRLLVQVHEPATMRCPAVQLGLVTVEAEGEGGPRSLVANVAAWLAPDGEPVWRLLRMQRNDWAPRPVPVAESRSDALGGVSLQALEEHFEETRLGVPVTSCTTSRSEDLDLANLALLFAAEAEALEP